MHFEELAFPLKDLATKEVVNVQHYLRDGSRANEYTELVDKNYRMWDLVK